MKIKKQKLTKEIYKWSTHTPVIQTFLKLIKPELAIELGVGRYSTPLFLNYPYAKKILHIDNEAGWLDVVKRENEKNIKNISEFRHHDLLPLGITSLKLLPSELNSIQKNEIEKYYNDFKNEVIKLNYKTSLIFTDGFASCRKATVDILTPITDVMIYHDAEKPVTYGYDKLEKTLYETHDEYVLETATSFTGFFIRKNLFNFEELKQELDNQISIYANSLGISKSDFNLVAK